MTHQWHDAYRHLRTPAHHLDPRSKLFAGLAFVACVLFTPRISTVKGGAYGLLLLTAALLARLPCLPILTRLAALLPFAFLMMISAAVSQLSPDRLEQVAMKSLLSMTAMAVVSMTTPFPDLLRALQQGRLPKTLILFLAFLYRYADVLRRESIQLERGWSARYFGRTRLRQWSRLGHVLAALLIRSYERAERIYSAMMARGFSSRSTLARLLHFSIWDFLFLVAAGGLLAWVRWGPLR